MDRWISEGLKEHFSEGLKGHFKRRRQGFGPVTGMIVILFPQLTKRLVNEEKKEKKNRLGAAKAGL